RRNETACPTYLLDQSFGKVGGAGSFACRWKLISMLICTPARCSRGDGVILQDRRMNSRRVLWRFGCSLALIGAVYAFQRPFRVYPRMEPYDDVPLPPGF